LCFILIIIPKKHPESKLWSGGNY